MLGLLLTSNAYMVSPIARPALAVQRTNPIAMQAPAALVAAPPDGYTGAVAAGKAKAGMSPTQIFGRGILSGCHIGFGAYLMLTVGAACPGLAATNPGLQKIILGAFGLPFGLFMTLMTGAELFTGNTALVSMAAYEGEATTDQVAKSWVMSYLGNFVGSVGLAFLVSVGATLVGGGASVGIAGAKTSLPFMKAFVRGILCNWLVCMAVWMATSADDIASKAAAVWFPVCGFAATGLDHSVANMFLIPFGMLQGADISVGDFVFKNLIPATLGNIVGGALCVAGVYKAAYGKPAVAAVHAPGAPVAVEQNEGGPGPFWWMSGSAPQVQQKPAGVELEHDAQRSKWSKGIPALA